MEIHAEEDNTVCKKPWECSVITTTSTQQLEQRVYKNKAVLKLTMFPSTASLGSRDVIVYKELKLLLFASCVIAFHFPCVAAGGKSLQQFIDK